VIASAGQPVWPGSWHEKAAAMLRRDLAAASIPYVIDGPEGPLHLDFHALRHGYVALLDRAGASLKEAMQLARHSDPKLTTARYGRAQFYDLAAVAARLPALLPGDALPARDAAALRPTGSGGIADPACLHAFTPLTQTGATDRGFLRLIEGENGVRGRNRTGLNSRQRKELRPIKRDRGRSMRVAAAGFEPATLAL